MNEGANILKGRNNNQLVLDKNGGVTVSTGTSFLLINSPNIPQPPVTTPSSETSNFTIPKLNITGSVTRSITGSKDIIPLYYPTESASKPSETLINITDTLLPADEEIFSTLFSGSQVFVQTDIIGSSDPLENPIVSPTARRTVFSGNISAVISAPPITKDTKDFATVTRQVIAYLEGGYYNPRTHDVGDNRYSSSGETMFGIDRKAGAPASAGAENPAAPPAAKEFWKKIGDAQSTGGNWRYLYIPPNPLQDELVDLTIKIIKPQFDQLLKKHYKPEIRSVIESDGRLLFNVIYAVWNGSGWFEALAKELTAYYNAGNKTADALTRWFVNRRIDATGLLGITRRDSSWSLFNQGGLKIEKLIYG